MNKKEEIPERNVWFYCQICHVVPSVQIIYDNNADPLLSITCNCGYKKEQLSKYLSKMLKYSDKNSMRSFLSSNKICSINKQHNMIKNSKYCLKCKIWLCENCCKIHNNLSENNHSFIEYEFLINCFCNIHKETSASYFCHSCQKSICYICTKNNHLNHFFEKLKNKYQKIEKDLTRNSLYVNYMNNKNVNDLLTNNILNIVNNEIKKLNEMKELIENEYQKQLKNNYEIYSFLTILYDNFTKSKKYNNYTIINNLINNTNFKKDLNTFLNLKDKNVDMIFKQYLLALSYNKLIEPKAPIILNKIKRIEINKKIKNLIVVDDYFIEQDYDSFAFFDKKTYSLKKSYTDEEEIRKIIYLKKKKIGVVIKNIVRIFSYEIFKTIDKIIENNEIIEIILSENDNLIILTKEEKKVLIYDVEKNKKMQEYNIDIKINKLIEIKLSFMICSSNEKVYLGKINHKNKLKCYYLCEHKNKINIIFKLISGKFILGSSDKISIYFEDKEFYSEMFSIINNCEIKRISEILNKYFFIALEDKTFKIYDQKTFNLSFVLTNEFQIDDLCQFDNDNLISFSDREILIWSCQMDSNILLGSSIFILSH